MDSDLDNLRQERLAQMQQQFGGGSNNEQQQKAVEMQKQQDDMKNSILTQILDQNARARLNTLKISKPEKAQMVEGMIIRMAQMGQLGGKLDDASLVKLLESLNQQMGKQTSQIKFDRRRAQIDSDSDEDYGI